MKSIYLITKNKGKIASAQVAFTPYSITVVPLDFDIPEIQASTSIEIAKYTVQEAYSKFSQPVMREDHGFFIDELNFPGPYMAYIEKSMPLEGIVGIIKNLHSNKAHFELAAAFIDSKGKLHEFVYSVPVILHSEPKGDSSQKWNRLISFEGEDKVFAEYAEDERLDVWNKNFTKIAELVSSQV